jgi:hypothetical protein
MTLPFRLGIQNFIKIMKYLLFLMVLVGFSCENPAPPESRPDKLAKSLCGCTTALLALNQQAQSASDSLAFRNIAAEFEKTRECVDKIGVQPDDRAALGRSLKNICPELEAQQDLLTELLGQ